MLAPAAPAPVPGQCRAAPPLSVNTVSHTSLCSLVFFFGRNVLSQSINANGEEGGGAAVLFVGWALAGQAEAFAPAPGLSLPSQCRGGRGTAIPSGIVGIRSNNLYMLFYFTTYFISNPHFGASLASMQGVFVVV